MDLEEEVDLVDEAVDLVEAAAVVIEAEEAMVEAEDMAKEEDINKEAALDKEVVLEDNKEVVLEVHQEEAMEAKIVEALVNKIKVAMEVHKTVSKMETNKIKILNNSNKDLKDNRVIRIRSNHNNLNSKQMGVTTPHQTLITIALIRGNHQRMIKVEMEVVIGVDGDFVEAKNLSVNVFKYLLIVYSFLCNLIISL